MATKKARGASSTNGASTNGAHSVDVKKTNKKPTIQNADNYSLVESQSKDSVMIDSRELLRVLTEVKAGNFSVRMPFDQVGLSGKICDTLNEIIALNEKMTQEFTRAGNTIGKQGKLIQRIEVPYAAGSWGTAVESINELISDLVHP